MTHVPQVPDDGGPVDYVGRLASDRDLRDHVRAAARVGVSLSRFLGRPRVVEYDLDEHGRIRQAVHEPDWTDEDRALLVALVRYEAATCSGCGLPLDESTHPDHEGEYAVDAARCHACTAIAAEVKGYADNPTPQALRYGARLRTRPTEGPTDAAALDAG